ncbi:MAG: TetR/AcrR family transcriptional regulator [Oscillibacter sp.]|nr:TetR/AcrR family transcriptional regulator [Oscillibacter sp.]
MNENDMRVIKTRESIERAFFDLLRTKPADKVTVVELAREARIHKSTFYLHYLDIPDLYAKTLQKTLREPITKADYFSLFFDDPREFLHRMYLQLRDNMSRLDLLLQGQGHDLYYMTIMDLLRQKIYETGRIKESPENDIKLEIIFGTLLSCTPRYHEHGDVLAAQIVAVIRFLFPEGSC